MLTDYVNMEHMKNAIIVGSLQFITEYKKKNSWNRCATAY